MANITKSFTKGKMNKSTDVRLMQDGEYIDALNVRVNSTEGNNVGSIENSKGNIELTTLLYIDGTPLSTQARCIGALEDGSNERLLWFVHDPAFTVGATGKLDLILSFDTNSNFLKYHVVSIDDGGGINTTLNFNPQYLITGVDLVENLFFFTDEHNAPRKINIDKSYGVPLLNVDDFSAESILVIKKPPVTSPMIQPINIGQEINYMEDRFLCFAYRYRYEDNEYSATSQFSEPAFFPKDFDFSVDSMLNEGMENKYNATIITFDSGGPLVVGIDLLYKEADDPTIKVIEKLNKVEKNYNDSAPYTYIFDNSKIYTILPDSEILRLYDNVPRLAKAQTMMGNRLIYGNYTDGYDLTDAIGNPVAFNYFTELVSEDLSSTNITETKSSAVYTIDGTAITVANGLVEFDLTLLNPTPGVNHLTAGTSINFDLEFLHSVYSGGPTPSSTNSFNVSFVFNLNRNYSSVYDLASSSEFIEKVGRVSTPAAPGDILPVYDPANPTSCSGYTFTDIYNCHVPAIATYTKYESGIFSAGEPIRITSLPTSKKIKMQFPAMKYVIDPISPTVNFVYDYFKINSAFSQFYNSSANRSLHSNRDYDIGIAYMDDFSRATTALVSERNTEHVACGISDKKNSIKVTIPTSQKPPHWATRYKFLIKPDKKGYDTIYSQFFYQEVTTNDLYFLLEGENSRKVEDGDRYIVKSDTGGPLNECAVATVLEKKAQEEDFITTTNGAIAPAGVYMKMSPQDFSTQIRVTPVYSKSNSYTTSSIGDFFVTSLACSTFSGGVITDTPVPARSRVIINFSYTRKGDLIGGCEERTYSFSKSYISTSDYNDVYDWFVGDGIQSTINSGTPTVGGTGIFGAGGTPCPMDNKFYGLTGFLMLGDLCTNKWYFLRPTSGAGAGMLSLVMTGTRACGTGKNKIVSGSSSIDIYEPNSSLVFETIPEDALPDLFYESSESFPITNNFHQGNVQNQTSGTSAIIDTDFFNCYSFGNGVESYKVLDSIVGRSFNLGNRAFSVSAQDYKEAHRFADLTYSGVYNDETNVNKLNEFNLGLLNFKPLEETFGFIQKLDGKKTNVLVLQEDKISYVLAGKNLLSDAGGGSALTSVPQVLGQQITKTDEYGISHNPESYVKYGADKFFTDAKRGAVIQMRGQDEGSSDQIKVISEQGMRSWFRDLFNTSFNTQKLGGFDPYMNEYVLSSNEELLPEEESCSNCNDLRSISVQVGNPYTFCIDAGAYVGMTPISWTGITGSVTIDAVYNGVTTTSGVVSAAGNFDVPKSLTGVREIQITVSTTGSASLDIATACPDVTRILVTWIVVSTSPGVPTGGPGSTGGPILGMVTTGISYDDGSDTSGLSTERFPLISTDSNPNVSLFNSYEGPQGGGAIPTDTSEVTMFVQKNQTDSYKFDVDKNRFMYYRSPVVYENNTADINFLLSNATTSLNIVEDDEFISSEFGMPQNGDNLYLIWDLREKSPLYLSYSNIDSQDACCGYLCNEILSEYTIVSSNEQIIYITYTDELGNPVEGTISPGEVKVVCSESMPDTVGTFTDVTITYTRCGCST